MRAILSLIFILTLVGCGTLSDIIDIGGPDPIEVQKDAAKALKTIEGTADSIIDDQEGIKKAVDDARAKDTEDIIEEELIVIDTKADDSIQKGYKIRELLIMVNEKSKIIESHLESEKKLKAQNTELREQLKSSRDEYFMIVYGICGFIIALSVALAWFGNPKAIAGAIFGLISIVTTVVIEQLLCWAPYIGAIGGVGILVMIILEARKAKSTRKALDHIVDDLPFQKLASIKLKKDVKKDAKEAKATEIMNRTLRESIKRASGKGKAK